MRNEPRSFLKSVLMSVRTFSALAAAEWKAVLVLETREEEKSIGGGGGGGGSERGKRSRCAGFGLRDSPTDGTHTWIPTRRRLLEPLYFYFYYFLLSCLVFQLLFFSFFKGCNLRVVAIVAGFWVFFVFHMGLHLKFGPFKYSDWTWIK